MHTSHQKRNDIQKRAADIWKSKGKRGLLAMATGSGKSKIAVDEIKQRSKDSSTFKALLVTPTEKLRDVTWRDEFAKWRGKTAWSGLDRECYASLHKIKGKKYDLVVLDEAHYITEGNSVFFENNKVKDVMALTATPPEDPIKQILLQDLAPIVYRYTLEEAVQDGLVTPFKIIVVEAPLDNSKKNIKSGTKAKPFMQTEKAKYEYLTNKISRLIYSKAPESVKKFAYLERMRFIYNLPSKVALAKQIIKKKMKGRYLVFGGSIAQIETLMGDNVYHSKSKDDKYNDFLDEKLDKLGAVKALNEGQNIPNLDMILVVQLNSKELDIIQRIGRVVRWRPDHTAVVYILIATGTQDEAWLQKALQGFDEDNITFKKAYQI